MDYMQMTDFCQRIDEMSVELLIQQFAELQENHETVKPVIAEESPLRKKSWTSSTTISAMHSWVQTGASSGGL